MRPPLAFILPFVATGSVVASVAFAAPPHATDPFLWLESVSGARATAWVSAENAKTLAVLERDPQFSTFRADAVAINGARDRIPAPEIVDGRVYNFWQDAEHVRGIWRSATIAEYAKSEPAWTTVLDLDALAKAEAKNWVWHGADCDSPSRTRCMISLSDGGEDASTAREFDLKTGRFVDGGFVLPHGKQSFAWVDDDTLLVSREWAPGELTSSGYPYIVKTLERGEPLASAVELYRGTTTDVSVDPGELHDGDGRRLVYLQRGLTTFESEKRLAVPGAPALALPLKAELSALVAGNLVVKLDDAWQVGATTYPQGALVSLDLARVKADPAHLAPTLVVAPGPRETIEDVGATRDRLVVTGFDNVRGRAFAYAPERGGGWSARALPFPDDSTIALATSDEYGTNAYLSVTSFLVPSTLWSLDAGAGTPARVKSVSPQFDASRDVVEQREATSRDGTQVPYFVVHPKAMKLDGTTPTILYAYGGFQVSETPRYSGVLGKLWLERGGAYALANIRGGGEFGPAWHEAGLTTHRQRIYDDFAAVADDLIAKKITSPRRLGIQGGSNGGLLMGVEFTQHPELWNAVDIQVPLLDMLRYEKIAAGSSWVGEYGSVSNPEQRAFLASISPYDNLRAGVRYPEPFVWTTTKDDRVGPQHARKFAAKLAAMGVPYLFYEVTEGGHGSGTNIAERSLTSALEYTYFTQKLMR